MSKATPGTARRRVERSELDEFERLARLPAAELSARLSSMPASGALALFRRVLAVRAAGRVPGKVELELPPGAQVSVPSHLLEAFVRHLIGRFAPAERPRAARVLELLPEDDPLVTPEVALSGAGLSKSLEHQSLDDLIDALLLRRVDEADRLVRRGPAHRELYPDQETFQGTHPVLLETSYLDVQAAAREARVAPGQRVIDIGSGYGRPGCFFGLAHPDVEFVGYELVPERAEEAERVARANGFDNVRFHRQDLSDPDFQLPFADLYFGYEPLSPAALQKLVADLRRNAEQGTFRIIAIGSRGPARSGGAWIDTLRALPWMRELVPADADWKFTVFESMPPG